LFDITIPCEMHCFHQSSKVVMKLGGIISVLLGFTTFQLIFLIRKGTQLRKQVEEEAEKYNEDGTLKENK